MKTPLTIPSVLFLLMHSLMLRQEEACAQIIPWDMISIPAGTFTMGSPLDENGRDFWPFVSADETQHEVTTSRALYLAETEITKARWDEVRDWAIENGYTDLPVGRNGYHGNAFGNHPVTEISWYDAVKWCNAKSEWDGYSPVYTLNGEVYRTGSSDSVVCDWNRGGYRLPTEAEWEYACRAGTVTAFYTGNLTQLFDSKVDPNLNIAGWYSGNSSNTHPVGQKQANAWGFYDMHGNVFEWCWDWHSRSDSAPATDPRGPGSGFNGRVFRGGSWQHGSRACRSAFRDQGWAPSRKFARVADIGFRVALSEAVAVPDWQAVIGGTTPPPRPAYGEPPQREPGKDSLIIVTHGWRPDITWVEAMTNAITTYLITNGLSNWQVHAHKWVEGAQFPLPLGPEIALFRGRREGEGLGQHLVTNDWVHLHLIGHSAGSALIQDATEKVRNLNVLPRIVLHCTFLDPYVGVVYGGRSAYGKGADWVDSYFSRDAGTVLTDKVLPHTYNVDLTWLDQSREEVTVVYSTPSGDVSQTCYQQTTSHGWPYQFYTGTIPTNTVAGSEGFGFPLSKEGGNWNFATNTYRAGRLKVLGKETPSCAPNPSSGLVSVGSSIDFSKLPSASVFKSSSEQVSIRVLDFTLKTASPAWLAVELPITRKVNFVSLETRFTSVSGSDGLLSVYWGTNVVGSVDESVALPGTQKHMFPLPETPSGGTKMLGFRLDAFSSVQSSVVVANVVLGFVGLREPFSLSLTGMSAGGSPALKLVGPSGFNYRLEFSTNLVHWSTLAVLVNTNGRVRFVDQTSTNTTTRFYQAVVP